MSREFTKVGVVGLGTMGAGIAIVDAIHLNRRHDGQEGVPALASRHVQRIDSRKFVTIFRAAASLI